jgi:SAM-dependent methyltransferase
MKPFSEACERNRGPILDVLRHAFADCRSVLEIGSGTGQHAAHFAAALPHLVWQTSDLPDNHAGIHAWLAEARAVNALPPLALDVAAHAWPAVTYDAVFSANTLHIVSWTAVERMFAGIGRVLGDGGTLCIYGPFNYGGRLTSASNARFDAMLRERDPVSGIRDFEAVDALARALGLALVEDVAMPANNRTLVWRRGYAPHPAGEQHSRTMAP